MRLRHFILLLSTIAFVACEIGGSDKEASAYSYRQADFVEAYVQSDTVVHYVITDDGDSICLSTPYKVQGMTTVDSAYRAIVQYDYIDNNKADVVNISQVPVVIPKHVSYFNNVLTHPIVFESIWVSKSRRYLNIGFYLKTGEVGDDAKGQTIGLVRDDVKTNSDGTHTIYLRLYHDQGDVPQYYSSKCYFSVPCDSIEADSVNIKINTYTGVVEKRLKLK